MPGSATLPRGDTASMPARREPCADDEIAVGERVGRYHLRRLIGEGGMGRVYLARDVTLGRSVAVKLVRRDRVDKGGLTRFLDEARVIASLNHPHIVQIYDVGEHRAAPYLALEYIEGESLKERSGRARMSVDETLRVLRAIAEALSHAHAAGVYHCDLKPGNVMLARDGRLRVVDFGLALTGTSQDSSVAGTPDWMAPEQWAGAPVTDRVDLWALAVIATQLLGGHHPFAGDSAARRVQVLDPDVAPIRVEREGVPDTLVELIARSLERHPAGRPAAVHWHRVLDDVIEGRDAPSLDEGPYRGLAPFAERHAASYFGRESEIDAFIERLRVVAVLPIVGPSGAGKSSMLFAGVIPRLRARERWTVIALRPGAAPFDVLAHGVLGIVNAGEAGPNQRAQLAGALRNTPTLLAARLATIASALNTRVLLVVDQLEELFTHGIPARDIEQFLDMLMAAADDPLEPVRVVFTLRDDFLGRVAGLRTLFVLKRLQTQDLRRTITGPLRRAGYRFDDDALIDEMLSELGDNVAAELPLLQFACRALWDGRDQQRRMLLRSTHQAIGGVVGALARHADGVLAELTVGEQRMARDILVGLVVGTTRRQIDRDRLLAPMSPIAGSVLDRLITARLVVQHTAAGGEVVVVEIAHESLRRTWAQFARWLDESRDERRLLLELEEAASFWERRGRRLEETWGIDELAAAHHRIAQLGVHVPPHVEAFLSAGEQRQRKKRRRSRIRIGVIAVVGLAVTVISVYFALEFRRRQLAIEAAGVNLGRFDLRLRPYDWVDGVRRPVDVDELPKLSWQLHERYPASEHEPGPPRAGTVLVTPLASHGAERLDRVDARGGPAFLRIDGRGRDGESCAPSWIPLQSLPGYGDRSGPLRTFDIPVPTCRASRATMIVIPAGEFVYGGPGEPTTRHRDDPTYVEPEQTISLDEFAIDRTEVSNAEFAAFNSLTKLTGYPAPLYPDEDEAVLSGDPEMPVTSIDAYQAEVFCRFMGKRLPGDHEWVKAARGGTTVDGNPNPAPKRLYPWGTAPHPECSNIAGLADGYDWLAPVDALPCGASPYGVLNLAGNVAEWISRKGQTDQKNTLREIRGGDAESPAELEEATTIIRNKREGRSFTFARGIRCVTGGKVEEDLWNGY